MKPDPLGIARALVAGWVHAGDTVVDATVGNGHDTLYLAKLVGPTGRVVGFDVQAAAILATRQRLEAAGQTAELHEESHAALPDHVGPGLAAAMFNLGYLPGANKAVTTRREETLPALAAALALLRPGGGITVVCYPGHAGGDAEADAVNAWAAGLAPKEYCAVRCHGLNAAPGTAAILIAVSSIPRKPPPGGR